MGNDATQPKQVTNGYFAEAEELKDFVDFLFDVKKLGNYKELYQEFLNKQESYGNNN